MPIMLKGPELLAKCQEMRGSAKSDLVRACGYVSDKGDKEKLHFTEFYDALLEARDSLFWGSPRAAAPRSSGRKRSNIIRANVAGALIIGKAYTSQLGIEHKDEFIIRLGRSGRITLIPRDEDPASDQDSSEGDASETVESAPTASAVATAEEVEVAEEEDDGVAVPDAAVVPPLVPGTAAPAYAGAAGGNW
jgi:hypothetical protein